MDAEFWHERWQQNEIGFHESQPNALLVRHYDRLDLRSGDRVFLPLCGKTLDIGWLLSKELKVCGVELNADAVEQLFDELGVEPEGSDCGDLRRYSAAGIDIFVGDVFALSPTFLGPVDAIYDRAALVALPKVTRERYASHLRQITASAPQLLICFDYDQELMEGPPFSIPENEVAALYGSDYAIENLAVEVVSGGLKGICAATEVAWLLHRH